MTEDPAATLRRCAFSGAAWVGWDGSWWAWVHQLDHIDFAVYYCTALTVVFWVRSALAVYTSKARGAGGDYCTPTSVLAEWLGPKCNVVKFKTIDV